MRSPETNVSARYFAPIRTCSNSFQITRSKFTVILLKTKFVTHGLRNLFQHTFLSKPSDLLKSVRLYKAPNYSPRYQSLSRLSLSLPPSMDPTFPLVPVVNFVGCFLVFVTFVTMRSRPWNTGVCMFGIWIFLIGLETGVNTTVYANNVKDVAPIWCDICKISFQY